MQEEQAIENYRKEHKKDFNHLQLYKVVASHSRWKQAIISSEEKKRRERAQKRPTATRGNDAAAEDDAAGDGASPFDVDGHTILTRPDGRAPEKERRRLAVQNRELIQSTSTGLNAYLGDQQSRNVKKDIELEKRTEWYGISCGNVTTIANSVSEMTAMKREKYQLKKEQQISYKMARYQHILAQPAPPDATVEQLQKLAALKNTALDKLNELMML